jgi:hypothetical protein
MQPSKSRKARRHPSRGHLRVSALSSIRVRVSSTRRAWSLMAWRRASSAVTSKISAYFQHYYYEKYGKNDDYEDHEWLKDALNYDTLTDIDKMICKFIMHIHIQQIQPPYRLSNEKERYKINTMKDTRMHRRNPYVTCPKCKRGFKLKNDKTFKKHDDNNSRSCTITDTTVTDTITELTGTENTLDDVIKLFHTKR